MGKIIICKDCGKEKKHHAKGLCKSCYGRRPGQREYMREWHKRTWPQRREKHREQQLIREAELREWFRALKASLKCERCGENHPACLDFHHIKLSEKEIEVSELKSARASKKRILAEIEKCIVLCANCHRKLHWEENQARENSELG